MSDLDLPAFVELRRRFTPLDGSDGGSTADALSVSVAVLGHSRAAYPRGRRRARCSCHSSGER